jgi:hypothetical protein
MERIIAGYEYEKWREISQEMSLRTFVCTRVKFVCTSNYAVKYDLRCE